MFHTVPTLHRHKPRSKRIVVPGFPHHITQRGNGRAKVFDCDQDRAVFLDLLAGYSVQYGLLIWGYCLMSNHFHLIGVPANEGTAAKVLGRLEADYARFLNVRRRTSGHLWQARYHSVAMEPPHSWRALAYVERNPVRASMASTAVEYPWSSAAARMGAAVAPSWLDLNLWNQTWSRTEWLQMLAEDGDDEVMRVQLQEATLSGHPLGQSLVERLEKELGRRLRRGKSGRPPKQLTSAAQASLFSDVV
jgi:putative transposase